MATFRLQVRIAILTKIALMHINSGQFAKFLIHFTRATHAGSKGDADSPPVPTFKAATPASSSSNERPTDGSEPGAKTPNASKNKKRRKNQKISEERDGMCRTSEIFRFLRCIFSISVLFIALGRFLMHLCNCRWRSPCGLQNPRGHACTEKEQWPTAHSS